MGRICKYCKKEGGDGRTLHGFPIEDGALLNIWKERLNLPPSFCPTKYSRICSDHFSRESFKLFQKRKTLIPGSVPEFFSKLKHCCIYCHATKDSKPGISLRKFPLNRPEILKKWLLAINIDNFVPNTESLICSDHFEKSCFKGTKTRRRLNMKQDAVPSIFFKESQKLAQKPEHEQEPSFDLDVDIKVRKEKDIHEVILESHEMIDVSNGNDKGLKMDQDWMRWCRLCARENRNSNNSYINVPLKDEEGLPLSDTIYKCFSIDIKSGNNFPKMICNDCYHHIKTTINLNQRIPKVTAMLEELLVKTEEELDLNKIKASHNLECDFNFFNLSPKEFEENDKFSEEEIIYHQNITLNPMTIKVEADEDDSFDNLLSTDDESSYDSTSSESTKGRNIPKIKKKYNSRKNRSAQDENKPHQCSECQKRFMKFCNYRRHMQIAHEITVENKRPLFICGKCGKECKSISSLKEHEFSHSEERTFKCKNCDKAFKSSLSLKQHEDTHNETRYICVVCGLQLNTQQTLRKHMVVHSDEKNYKCDYCGNGYKRAKALKAHLILHTGLRPYTCDFCEKTFANVSNCRGHMKKLHPIELAALEASGKNKTSIEIPKLNELRAITANKAEIIRPNDRGKEFCQDIFQ